MSWNSDLPHFFDGRSPHIKETQTVQPYLLKEQGRKGCAAFKLFPIPKKHSPDSHSCSRYRTLDRMSNMKATIQDQGRIRPCRRRFRSTNQATQPSAVFDTQLLNSVMAQLRQSCGKIITFDSTRCAT